MGFGALFLLVLALAIASNRYGRARNDPQDLLKRLSVGLPRESVNVGAAELDGNTYVKLLCNTDQIAEFVSQPVLSGVEALTSVQYLDNDTRLGWWDPEHAQRFTFFDARLPNGDALQVLLVPDNNGRRTIIYLMAFEI